MAAPQPFQKAPQEAAEVSGESTTAFDVSVRHQAHLPPLPWLLETGLTPTETCLATPQGWMCVSTTSESEWTQQTQRPAEARLKSNPQALCTQEKRVKQPTQPPPQLMLLSQPPQEGQMIQGSHSRYSWNYFPLSGSGDSD